MAIINFNTGKLSKPQEFKGRNPEEQLQKIIVKYLPELFQCYFLNSLKSIPHGVIDTLAITKQGNPCILEYLIVIPSGSGLYILIFTRIFNV